MDSNLIQFRLAGVKSREAKMGQSFTPALGQLGLNIKLFCDSFNSHTVVYRAGIPFRVNAIFDKNQEKFLFIYCGPSLSSIISFYEGGNKFLTLEDFWRIFIVYAELLKLNSGLTQFLTSEICIPISKIILGSIQSMGIKVIS